MKTPYLLLAILALSALPLASALADVTSVVVVRHAEKSDDGTDDPALVAAGRARAEALARVLAQTNVTGLIASQYRRTRQTLAALAKRHDLEVAVVPAESGSIEAHVEGIAELVREWNSDGVVVIAGHSNTVPLIVEALSGEQVSPIDETEYDRLFILLPSDSGMNFIDTRYGAESESSAR